jgi:hypothetical protein
LEKPENLFLSNSAGFLMRGANPPCIAGCLVPLFPWPADILRTSFSEIQDYWLPE